MQISCHLARSARIFWLEPTFDVWMLAPEFYDAQSSVFSQNVRTIKIGWDHGSSPKNWGGHVPPVPPGGCATDCTPSILHETFVKLLQQETKRIQFVQIGRAHV